jgi:hypothetical protein
MVTSSLPESEKEQQWCINNFWYSILVIKVAVTCKHPYMKYWPPLAAKIHVTHSLPHPATEHQCSINNFWSSIMANLSFAVWQ